MVSAFESALLARGVRFSARHGVVQVLDGVDDITAVVRPDPHGVVVSIGGWHEHAPLDEDGVDWLAGLIECWVMRRARLVTITRLGIPVAWRVDALTPSGEWQAVSETGLLIPPFWPRREHTAYCTAPYDTPSAPADLE